MKHPVWKWCTLAAIFRYLGIIACDYWGPYYFLRYYPDHVSKFLTIFPLLILTCGFSSALLWGIICDRYGQGKPMMKAIIPKYLKIAANVHHFQTGCFIILINDEENLFQMLFYSSKIWVSLLSLSWDSINLFFLFHLQILIIKIQISFINFS